MRCVGSVEEEGEEEEEEEEELEGEGEEEEEEEAFIGVLQMGKEVEMGREVGRVWEERACCWRVLGGVRG